VSHDDLGAEAHIGSKPEWSDATAYPRVPRTPSSTFMLGWVLLTVAGVLVGAAALLVIALY
jgi:hypothetical protein